MTVPPPVDPQSPVPLYHQIAESIRWQIESGELRPSETLEPLRRAAEQWGVNLHTVRHAYAALAREGLIEIQRGPGGTRVAKAAAGGSGATRDQPRAAQQSSDLDAFIDGCLREARVRFGVDRARLASLIERKADEPRPSRPTVFIVECSALQCEAHARELAEWFEVDARPWPLDRGEPPAGIVVATYFHYNDIRRRWPRRLASVHFVTIRPDPALRSRLRGRTGDVLVCERDLATAEAVAGDLEALFAGEDLRFLPIEAADPDAILPAEDDAITVLFPPRVWADLSEEVRRRPGTIEVVYRFDLQELEELAGALLWPAARGAAPHPARSALDARATDHVPELSASVSDSGPEDLHARDSTPR